MPVRASRAGRSRGGKPRELRGGEQTHSSGGSGLVVAKHGRVEEGPRAAVAKWMCTDYVAFISLDIATWLAVFLC